MKTKTVVLEMVVKQAIEVPEEWTPEHLDGLIKDSNESYQGSSAIPFRHAGKGKVQSWDVRLVEVEVKPPAMKGANE